MQGRSRRPLALAAAGACALALVALFTVPVYHPFNLREAAIYDFNPCAGIDPTKGTLVRFVWSAPSHVFFVVVDCKANSVIYSAKGTSGSDSFVAQGGTYEFGATCPVGPCVEANVSGTYSGPLLSL